MQVSTGKYNILLASSVVVVTAIIICVVFYESYQTKLVHYQKLNTQLNKESKRFSKLDDMSLLAAEYQERFNSYMPVEQYENENRLYWLDSLEKIRSVHKIPRLSYSISARKPYLYDDGIISDKGVKVSVSDVSLKMNLMHEADLMAVIDSINKIKKSIHVLSSCQLKRLGLLNKETVIMSAPNIEATCNVKWYTFKVG